MSDGGERPEVSILRFKRTGKGVGKYFSHVSILNLLTRIPFSERFYITV